MNTKKETKRYRIDINKLESILEDATPNPEQREAVNGLVDWFMNWDGSTVQHKPAILAALAGCGKSYLFSLLVLTIIRNLFYRGAIVYSDQFELVLAAPSNRAADVMREFSQHSDLWLFCKVHCTTVHSLSGLVMGNLDEDGKRVKNWQDFDRENTETNRSGLSGLGYSLTVVDEYPMISDYLYEKQLANYHDSPILYMGNLEQLAPVDLKDRKAGTSIIDDLHSDYYFTLTEVMRHDGGILAYSRQVLQQYALSGIVYSPLVKKIVDEGMHTDFNQFLKDVKTKVFLPFDESENVFVGSRMDVLQTLLDDGIISSSLLDRGIDYFKAICYTNKSVDTWNKIIRKMIFGEAASSYHLGETFIVKSPVYEIESGSLRKMFFTNQFIRLEEVNRIKLPLKDPFGMADCCVKFPDINLDFFQFRAVNRYKKASSFLHPTPQTEKILTVFFLEWKKVIETYSDGKFRARQFNYWESCIKAYGLYYKNDPKSKSPFAPHVQPGYAATCHSYQGSTCDHVVLDWDDIQSARGIDNKLRLSYVGVTRAKKHLYLSVGDQ